ncbi:MAG: LicD family protein [Anaerovoracaceae bacterium]
MTNEQKHLLMLFKEINEICQRHDIVYYMAGGTLIGAVRHKGFIPWDDDMDLLMTRDNWHKFIEVTKTDIPENRVLDCQEMNRDYPNMFGRYADTTSTAIHKNQVLGDGIAGYVIDIFVLDPISDSEIDQFKYTSDIMLYSDLINPSLNYSYRWNLNGDRFNEYYSKMKRHGKEAVLSQLEKEMFSYKEEDCSKYVMRWGGVPFIFEKDMYGFSRWGVFEGIPCRIPDRTADYLTLHYGDDWMYIPPHEEHESHEAIFSFTTDYKTIQDDYMRYIDVPKTRKALIKRKKYFFKHMADNLALKDSMIQAQVKAKEMEIEQDIKDFEGDLDEMLDQSRYDELSDFFEEYYTSQGSRDNIGRRDYSGIYRFNNPGLIDINDDVMYVAVMTLIHTNRIAKASRFIEVRERIKSNMNEKLKFAKALIGEIREAISDYDLGHKDEAYKKVETLSQKYPNNVSILLFRARLLLEYEEYAKAEEVIERGIARVPENGDFYKYLGDLWYRQNKDKAYCLYEKAFNLTTNGYVLMEIEEKIKLSKEELGGIKNV